MALRRSRQLIRRAEKRIPGGVNSPVRAYGSVGGAPPFIERARGARLWDVDGNEYLDYVGSWGPMILGHADPGVLKAVRAALARGTSFGAPTEAEIDLADAVRRALPSVEMLRMVSSGTEAGMSAVRLARAATGRTRVLKFEGCYHGHSDGLLVGAGSGVATLGIPGSPGVPAAMTELTVQAPYNDLEAVEDAFRRWGDDLAAVLVEPVAGNMGCVLPGPGFLEGLRELCTRHGALLVFDEVMTGFRVARGGAQIRYGVTPDLTCLGKVVGGGLPAAAYGGRRDLMEHVAPAGNVYQAGTLSGNPLAVAAGLETLRRLEEPGSTTPWRRAPGRSPRGSRSSPGRPPWSSAPPRPGACSACSSTPAPSAASRTPGRPTSSASAASSTPCWSRASTWRRPRSRPASSPSPTARATWTAPWRRPARPSGGRRRRVEALGPLG